MRVHELYGRNHCAKTASQELRSHSKGKVLTQSILQIHLLESRGGNETAARDGEPTHVGNFQADGNSGEVEQLTLLAASYLQWQGGFGVGTMKNA